MVRAKGQLGGPLGVLWWGVLVPDGVREGWVDGWPESLPVLEGVPGGSKFEILALPTSSR